MRGEGAGGDARFEFLVFIFFFFQAEDGIRDLIVTGVQTCALPIYVLDLAVANRVVEKSGAWFSYGGERLGQGRENSKQTLRDNPEMRSRIENDVRSEERRVGEEGRSRGAPDH